MAKKQSNLQQIWHDYSLSIVLTVLFILSWLGQFFVELKQVSKTQKNMEEFLNEEIFGFKFGLRHFITGSLNFYNY